ncbi:hypothetical protein ELD60_06625 [Klebsiella pneumoniae]|nr:hypothetical protein [Klebsiella pneumoniae]MBL2088248.1 hypothetical protein [Klebsiella pneumoniae]OSH53217.1 hypothetical protein B7D65_10480 [Klebsiella pneumoniae]RBN30225.1 hypothetical protein DRB11_08295 [Klebsiella pneumoniae]
MMSLWDALRMNMMISYQELVRTFLSSPRDETKDWFYLKHYQGAERFTTFTDFDLPYLALFKAQGALTNPYALDYLQLRTDQIQRQLARNT